MTRGYGVDRTRNTGCVCAGRPVKLRPARLQKFAVNWLRISRPTHRRPAFEPMRSGPCRPSSFDPPGNVTVDPHPGSPDPARAIVPPQQVANLSLVPEVESGLWSASAVISTSAFCDQTFDASAIVAHHAKALFARYEGSPHNSGPTSPTTTRIVRTRELCGLRRLCARGKVTYRKCGWLAVSFCERASDRLELSQRPKWTGAIGGLTES